MKMNICFVLPEYCRKMSGGSKMVFEYANRLSKKGHDISILYINDVALKNHNVPSVLKPLLIDIMVAITPSWIKLDNRINRINGKSKDLDERIKNIDIAIATSVETANYTKNLFKNKKLAYFIQDFEAWGDNSEDYVISTYKLGFKNIVVSNWLKEIVDKNSLSPSVLIKNPIDTSIYKPLNNDRYTRSIAFLYHKDEHKGLRYTIEAIKILKEKYEDLKVYAFGACKRGEDLPAYVEYKRDASQSETVDIYNKANVFICSTIDEGYGLTGLEAMASGCVLCSSAYKGVFEYAIDNYNALLSNLKDSKGLADNVIKVFENDKLKYKLVNNGLNTIKNGFDWGTATNLLEKTLSEL